MSEPAKKILNVMKTIGTQTNYAPSQLIQLQIKSLYPLVFKRDDKIEIDKTFYVLDRNFSIEDLEIGDSVQALAVNDNQSYYIFGNRGSGEHGTSDYTDLINKPSINGTTLVGNKTTSDLGITIPTKTSDLINDSNFITEELDPNVAKLTNTDIMRIFTFNN